MVEDRENGNWLERIETYFTDQRSHWQTHHESLKHEMNRLFGVLIDEVVTLKDVIMGLQVDVANLVQQVAQNTSIEESSALALTGLTAKINDLTAQIAVLSQQATISPEDVAALQGASQALAQSAKDLTAAAPANTGTPPVVVDPVLPANPNPSPADPNNPQGVRSGRRF